MPNVQHLRRFGCVAYVLNKGGIRKKFETKIKKGIFVGYSENKTYRVYTLETKSIVCDCNVRFNELNCVKDRRSEDSKQNNLDWNKP